MSRPQSTKRTGPTVYPRQAVPLALSGGLPVKSFATRGCARRSS
jgi:hypothetical protein